MILHASYHGHIIPLLVFFLCFVIVAVVIIVSVFIFLVAFVMIVFVPSLLRNLEEFCLIFWDILSKCSGLTGVLPAIDPPKESPNFESHMQNCTLVVILSTLRSIGGYRQITLYQRNLMKCWLSLDDATCELSWFESHTSLFGFFLRFVVVVFIYCLCGNLQVFCHVCKILLNTWWPYQLNRSCNSNGEP